MSLSLEEAFAYIIDNDLVESLEYLLDGFDIDPHDEHIFERAFKNHKLKCAKYLFEKGISQYRLNSCLDYVYGYTPEQIQFLVEVCGARPDAFPKEVYERYKKPEKNKRDRCVVS
jgi:hypothetical protein